MNMSIACIALAVLLALSSAGCSPTQPNDLSKLPTVPMTIKGKPFRLWIADNGEEQLRGLMFVTAEQMKPLASGEERGMIFVFNHDQTNSFWMKNTIIPLDIAYVASDGTVVSTSTMAALDDRPNQYPPAGPYRYAIEVTANRFVDLGLRRGDKLQIPAAELSAPPSPPTLSLPTLVVRLRRFGELPGGTVLRSKAVTKHAGKHGQASA